MLGVIGRGTGFDPLLGSKGAQFKADKFTWIGSANNEVSICVAWKGSGIAKFEDTLSKELIVGGTGAAADTDQFPRMLNGVLGTKFKIVSGYPGGNDITLAMERGEVKGRCGWSWSSIVATHKRGSTTRRSRCWCSCRSPSTPTAGMPLVMDFAKTEEQKRSCKLMFARQVMGRPFLAPPGVPKERPRAAQGVHETMKDPNFSPRPQDAISRSRRSPAWRSRGW